MGTELITPAREKLLVAANRIAAKPAGSDDIAYLARVMIFATLPHKKPSGPVFTRKNGNFLLTVTSGERGLPYGIIPRLILIWLCTEVQKKKKREIELGDSLSHFMAALSMVPTGGRWGSIPRLREQMLRLFEATFLLSEDLRSGVHGRKVDVADDWCLCWDWREAAQTTIFPNQVVVSERFFNEIIAHPVPCDVRMLRALTKSPLALDLYLWTSYRVYSLKHPLNLKWEDLQAQLGAEYDRVRAFREAVKEAMIKVKVVYTNLKYDAEDPKHFVLYPGKTSVPIRRKKAVK